VVRNRKTIALVFPPIPSYSKGLTEGVVERHLAHRDWTLIELPRLIVGQSPLPEGELHLDGAIVWAEPRDHWVLDLVGKGVKVVNCGTEWVATPGVASVHFRHGDLHRAVVQHLGQLGLRRVVVMGHRLDKRPATRRVLEEMVNLAGQAGLEARLWELGGLDSPSVMPRRLLEPEKEHELEAFLKGLELPTAVVCAGDHMGFIVCEVAARLGLRVPEDLPVVGQGDNLLACFAHPPLTTVAGPARAVGCAAADCLAQWLAGGDGPPPAEEVPGSSLIVRESTVGKSGSAVLQAVRRRIAEAAAHGVTLNELVALSGLSVKTLVHRYQEAFGVTPVEEIQQLRLVEAKRLLEQAAGSLAQTAVACGFSSQAAFCNYFRRHVGQGPGEWRAAIKAARRTGGENP
jgi:AraC-like DNA-binding protein